MQIFIPLHFQSGPSLNTQSCIKGLLEVGDFCFWAVWAARLVLNKNGLGRLLATFEGGFLMFSGAKKNEVNVFKKQFLKK